MDHFTLTPVLIALSILAMTLISYFIIKSSSNSKPKTPPGPRGVPVLGYIPFMDANFLHQFSTLARQYGPIYKLRLGTKLTVIINSPSLVKEVVRDQDATFANRDVPVSAYVATYSANDIAWSPHNAQWRAMRKIFVREMMSNKSLDLSYTFRKEGVRRTIRHVYEDRDAHVEINKLSFQTELNVITNLLWGGVLEGGEGARAGMEFRGVVRELVDLLGKPNISDFYPFLAGFDIQGVKRQMERYIGFVDRIFETIIAEHRKILSRGAGEEGRKNFLQILLELNEEDEDSKASISDTQLKAVLLDIVVGGTDTTATTIEWAMAELMNNPNAMEKAQNELSDVVGLDNIVEEHHIPKLKYLDAVVKETLRLHPAIPLLVPRSPTHDAIVGGYTIPAKTRVFINVAYIQKDPQFWESPMEFKPHRFLDGKWDFSGNNFQYIPFGSGRRMCAGQPLAERMLMYLLGSLLHSFNWKLPDDLKLDMSESSGIMLRKTFPLVAIASPRLSHSGLFL